MVIGLKDLKDKKTLLLVYILSEHLDEQGDAEYIRIISESLTDKELELARLASVNNKTFNGFEGFKDFVVKTVIFQGAE